MIKKPLEKSEIKFLKKELRTALFYGMATFIFFVFIFLLSLKGAINISPLTVVFTGIFFTGGVIWLLGYDYYKDLKVGTKEIVEKKLEIHEDERKIKKSKTTSVLDAWGKSKKKKKNFLIHVDIATFEVEKEFMEKAEEKGVVKLSYSIYSKKLLNIEV